MSDLELLLHTIATLAYRGGKALKGAPEGFDSLQAAPGVRTPGQILAHIGDLFDWAIGLVGGQHIWNDSQPMPWNEEVARFFRGLEALDTALANAAPDSFPVDRIFQGPIADAFTHVGQIALLRRLADAPIRAENYYKAQIRSGRVGPDQLDPVVEFG